MRAHRAKRASVMSAKLYRIKESSSTSSLKRLNDRRGKEETGKYNDNNDWGRG